MRADYKEPRSQHRHCFRCGKDGHKEGRNKWRQTGHWRHPRWYDPGFGWRGRYGFRSGYKYGCDPENPWCEYHTIAETKEALAATTATAHANEEFEAEKALEETSPIAKQEEQ
ncbi:MAG TPA: hypothetical protein VFF04_07270 [Candidatus Babeliales bacterium]|nr:hypothetical protein [Candidatus Babeliales bacterium]